MLYSDLMDVVYNVANDSIHIHDDTLMCKYEMLLNRSSADKSNVVTQHGMLFLRFDSSSNKVKELQIVFDVMSFMQQLQRSAAMLPEQCIVPNTVEMVLQKCSEVSGFNLIHNNTKEVF